MSILDQILRIAKLKLEPDEVFTPRSANINPKIYVPRQNLERELKEAVSETRHIIIHGESGNGKSWLYKKVFTDLGLRVSIINLAIASSMGSLGAAFQDKVNKSTGKRAISKTDTKEGVLAPGGVGVKTTSAKTYEITIGEPFEALLKEIKGKKGKPTILVLDNFEQIVNDSKICKEISNIIILADDEDYSKYRVKVCIVGIPSDIKKYLSTQSNVAAIAGRVREISEVERMSEAEARALFKLGFRLLQSLEIEGNEEKLFTKLIVPFLVSNLRLPDEIASARRRIAAC